MWRTWPQRWRWAGIAWLISRCCGSSRGWPGRWRRIRWCPGWSGRWRRTGRGRWRRSGRRRSGPGRWPGDAAPAAGGGLVTVDLDATIVIAHWEKEQAAPDLEEALRLTPDDRVGCPWQDGERG